MSFSTAVVRNGITYIFTNGQNEARKPTIRITTIEGGNGSVTSLRVNGAVVPPSDGPLAGTIVDNGVNGIRLYVINSGQIIEYGLDPEDDASRAQWKKETFTTDIKLDEDSFLTAFGAEEFGKGSDTKLRLFYKAAGAGRAVTESTYAKASGWSKPKIIET